MTALFWDYQTRLCLLYFAQDSKGYNQDSLFWRILPRRSCRFIPGLWALWGKVGLCRAWRSISAKRLEEYVINDSSIMSQGLVSQRNFVRMTLVKILWAGQKAMFCQTWSVKLSSYSTMVVWFLRINDDGLSYIEDYRWGHDLSQALRVTLSRLMRLSGSSCRCEFAGQPADVLVLLFLQKTLELMEAGWLSGFWSIFLKFKFDSIWNCINIFNECGFVIGLVRLLTFLFKYGARLCSDIITRMRDAISILISLICSINSPLILRLWDHFALPEIKQELANLWISFTKSTWGFT